LLMLVSTVCQAGVHCARQACLMSLSENKIVE
jgi:hypothetical protein